MTPTPLFFFLNIYFFVVFFDQEIKDFLKPNLTLLPPKNSIYVCFGIGATIRICQKIQCLP